jgi:hypothetical protein
MLEKDDGEEQLELCDEFMLENQIDMVEYLATFGGVGLLQEFQDWLSGKTYLTQEAAGRTDRDWGVEGAPCDCTNCGEPTTPPLSSPPRITIPGKPFVTPEPPETLPNGMDEHGFYLGGDVSDN